MKAINKQVFYGEWNNAEDMLRDFNVDSSVLEKAKILYAVREYGHYDGWCFVLFKRGRKLYEVNGSHCSCYGLEGQWEPEEVSVEALRRMKPDFAEEVFGPSK